MFLMMPFDVVSAAVLLFMVATLLIIFAQPGNDFQPLARSPRSLGLCLTCGLNDTFLEEGETMTPTELDTAPTSSPVVVPDSQLGLELPHPSSAPSTNATAYSETVVDFDNSTTAQALTDAPTESSRTNTPIPNTSSGSAKGAHSSGLHSRSRWEGVLRGIRHGK
jgi:hypothetical protein